MVKVERSFPAPESLAKEAKKAAGNYDSQDVIERLKKDFHNKCYICEIRNCKIQMWSIYFHIKMENIQKENLIGKIFFGHVGSDKRWKLLQKETI